MASDRVGARYEHELAYAYHQIDKRGILFHEPTMLALKQKITGRVDEWLDELSFNWKIRVFLGAENSTRNANVGTELNLNSPDKLLKFLQSRGFNLPKVRKKNKDTHEISFEESVDELVLRKTFAETGDSNIKRVLDIREFNTLRKRYIDARRYEGVFLCNYSVASTITGRRGSRKHIFGYGGNAQTFPKHYDLSKEFRKGIIARQGKFLFIVDQMSAEDWPVSALSQNTNALLELESRADRHLKLALYIFGLQENSRTRQEWKDSIERYLGKKTRHANNYRMKGQTMSDSLAKEGFAFTKQRCDELLLKVNQYDPSIAGVFHKYVDKEVYATQTLTTPFGRECHFHGLRGYGSSGDIPILSEATAFVPQSVVGDNTGFAVLHLSRCNDYIIQECHDSITQECPNNEREVRQVYADTRTAFDRRIRFHNGIEIQIPVEAEFGFNLAETVTVKDFTEENCVKAWKEMNEKYRSVWN